MNILLATAGKRLLESLSFTRTLYAFDFDGTLAKIVARPQDARMTPKVALLLRRLSALAPVAVISGRSLEDLCRRVDCKACQLIGNHGAQGLPLGRGDPAQSRAACNAWRTQLAPLLTRAARAAGLFLEDKTFSLAVHYRQAKNKKQARARLFEAIQKLSPAPRLVLGKQVVNLVPVGAPHKGVAVLELMMHAEVKCAFYIGDDDTDEDVFALPDARVITARVGRKTNSEAQFYLRRQTEIAQLIELLCRYEERAESA